MIEELEVWFRDPVKCVEELLGNPAFRETMTYAPEKIFGNLEGTQEVWNEMHTAEWWWETQVSAIPVAIERFFVLTGT